MFCIVSCWMGERESEREREAELVGEATRDADGFGVRDGWYRVDEE